MNLKAKVFLTCPHKIEFAMHSLLNHINFKSILKPIKSNEINTKFLLRHKSNTDITQTENDRKYSRRSIIRTLDNTSF